MSGNNNLSKEILQVELVITGTAEEIERILDFCYEADINVESGGDTIVVNPTVDVCRNCQHFLHDTKEEYPKMKCSAQNNRHVNGFESCREFSHVHDLHKNNEEEIE